MRLLMVIVFGLFAALAYAEKPQVTTDLGRVAEKIRKGEIKLKGNFSMNFDNGRYHEIHADIMLLECSTCHIGERYKEGVLNFSKYKPLPEDSEGQFEKTPCLGCHQEGGIATTFYTPSTE